MFDLKASRENLNHISNDSEDEDVPDYDVTLPYGHGRFVGETDL